MIDAVITYVDGSDKNWLEKYRSKVIKPIEETETRYRSYDCLDLQVRLIRKFMKFVDNIFIVVDCLSQVEKYSFTEEDNVTIVTHEEIIPKRYLPCFNSCTIEMFFYNIKDLKENFVYFNDDVFVVSECTEDDFFVNGKPCISFNEKNIELENNDSIFDHNIANSCNILKEKFPVKRNRKKYVRPSHSIIPLKKSAYTYIWTKCFNDVDKSLTRTRHRRNYNVYLFTNYEYYVRSYVNKKLPMKFYTVIAETQTIYDDIKNDNLKSICMNDIYIYDFNEWKVEFIKMLSCLLNDIQYVAPVKEEPKLIDTPLKVALCAIAKNENLYIREWVEWYKNLGISKIFLYDNNELDGERFEEVINDYIENGFVEVINRRGITKTVTSDKDGQTLQGLCYGNCYYGHYSEYNWMCFFDIDEFLEIYDKYDGLFDFLFDFSEFDGIRVQWKMFGDNNQLYYENKPVMKRFKKESNSSYDRHVKQIINCHKEFDEELLFCAHGVLNKKYNFVNLKKEKLKNVYMDIIYHDDLPVYLNHFYCKSTEEFFKRKYNKTSAVTGINTNRNFNIDFLKNQYFEHNERTEEKERFIDIFINSNNSVNVYMASLYKDGHVIESIKSILRQPQVKTLTLSANNYTDEQYNSLLVSIDSSKLVVHRTNNEKLSFEKLRFVNEDRSTKYVAFCDDDLIYYDGYFRKMISECELLDAVVSYHGGILKKLPIEHYYPDRKTFSFNKEVKENNNVDIIGNGVSLFKRDWITYEQWKNLYDNASEVSMDDITVSYTLRKNGYKLVVVKHSTGEVTERKDNKLTDTVYNIYKKNDSVQTDWVNKYFVEL